MTAGDETCWAKAAAILCAFIAAGYTPGSVNDVARANDLSLLRHPGRFPVELRPPDDDEGPGPALVGGR